MKGRGGPSRHEGHGVAVPADRKGVPCFHSLPPKRLRFVWFSGLSLKGVVVVVAAFAFAFIFVVVCICVFSLRLLLSFSVCTAFSLRLYWHLHCHLSCILSFPFCLVIYIALSLRFCVAISIVLLLRCISIAFVFSKHQISTPLPPPHLNTPREEKALQLRTHP